VKRVKQILLWVMGLLYVAAGINHFVSTDFYVRIMPPYVPFHLAMVYLSGVAEIALGVAVLIPKTRRIAAWGIIALLVAVFPANVNMLLQEPLGAPVWLLWLRLPLQGVLIAWAYWYTRPDSRLTSE
jgi:uncharacterized membrane protein